MTSKNLLDDLDYVRTLAEEGRSAPLLGGRFMVFWGVLVSLTLGVHWAIVTDRLDVPMGWLFWMWLGMGVGGGLISGLLGASIRSLPGASATNNRASGAVWGAMNFGLLATAIGIFCAVTFQGAPLTLWNILPGVVLVLYGMAYLAVAFFQKAPLQVFAGAAALVAGAGALALVQSPDAYLAAAAGVVGSTLIPGLIYLAREPKLTV